MWALSVGCESVIELSLVLYLNTLTSKRGIYIPLDGHVYPYIPLPTTVAGRGDYVGCI